MSTDLQTVAELARKLRGQTVTDQAEALEVARSTLYDWRSAEPAWWGIVQAIDLFEALRARGKTIAIIGRSDGVHGLRAGSEYPGEDLLDVLVQMAEAELAR